MCVQISQPHLLILKGPNSSKAGSEEGAILKSAVALKRKALLKKGGGRMLGDSQGGLPSEKTRVSSLFTASSVNAAHLEAVGRSHTTAEK